MARPIKSIERDPQYLAKERTENIESIVNQIAENREVIQDSLTILKELHESGLLDIVKGLLSTREKVGALAMEQINQPGMLNILRNVISGVEFLSSIDSKQLNHMLAGISNGLEHVSDTKTGSASLWGTIKATKDPNVLMALQTIVQFLEGMGKSVSDQRFETR